MKSPRWALVVGFIMILVGSCSVNKHVQLLKVPELIDMKNGLLDDVSIEINSTNIDSLSSDLDDITMTVEEAEELEDLIDFFSNLDTGIEEALIISEYAETWLVRLGYAGIAFAIIYILGGLMLLIPKPASIQVAYIGLGLALIFNIIHWIVISLDPNPGLLSQSTGSVNILGIGIDLLLLAIVYLSDKSAFTPPVE